MELRNYETVFILNPVLSETQIKDTVERFTKLMKANKVEIVNEEAWGLKSLQYPIKKKGTGYYFLFEFKSASDFIKTLEIEFNREENVYRFLTTALDKFAVAYNEKRKKGSFKKKSETAA